MPLYTYECEACDITEEVWRRMSECLEPWECECGATMKKLISLTAPPKFKGSGFYCNEYPRKDRPQ